MIFIFNSSHKLLFLYRSRFLLALNNTERLSFLWIYISRFFSISKSFDWIIHDFIGKNIRSCPKRGLKWSRNWSFYPFNLLIPHFLYLHGVLKISLTNVFMHLLTHLFFKVLILLIQILANRQRPWCIIDKNWVIHG